MSKHLTAKKETHILVIRLSAMGDVAMTVPVLRTLVAAYPKVKVTVLTRQFFAPIFMDIPNVSVFFADVKGEHKGILGLSKLAKTLRKLGIDAVADLHNVLRSTILKSFFSLHGIKVVQVDKGRAEKKALTRAEDKIFIPLKTMHQRHAEVFEALGFPIVLDANSTQNLGVDKPALTPAIAKLTKNSTKKWLGIAPFAQYESKTYPLALMTTVIERLNAEDRFEIFLFGGGEKEREFLNAIRSNCANVINCVGELSFKDELKLIANLDGMLAMDSGNAHLAAMCGVPTLTVWGVTHPYAGFMPFGQPMEHAILPDLKTYPKIPTSIYGNKVPEGYEKVMHSITPDAIVARVNSVV